MSNQYRFLKRTKNGSSVTTRNTVKEAMDADPVDRKFFEELRERFIKVSFKRGKKNAKDNRRT
jgi:hypothetical protein